MKTIAPHEDLDNLILAKNYMTRINKIKKKLNNNASIYKDVSRSLYIPVIDSKKCPKLPPNTCKSILRHTSILEKEREKADSKLYVPQKVKDLRLILRMGQERANIHDIKNTKRSVSPERLDEIVSRLTRPLKSTTNRLSLQPMTPFREEFKKCTI